MEGIAKYLEPGVGKGTPFPLPPVQIPEETERKGVEAPEDVFRQGLEAQGRSQTEL